MGESKLSEDGMAEVTEADREKAAEVLMGDVDYQVVRDAIAVALAEEREKARALFLALADEYTRESGIYTDAAKDESDGVYRSYLTARSHGAENAATRICHAAGVTE